MRRISVLAIAFFIYAGPCKSQDHKARIFLTGTDQTLASSSNVSAAESAESAFFTQVGYFKVALRETDRGFLQMSRGCFSDRSFFQSEQTTVRNFYRKMRVNESTARILLSITTESTKA